MYLLLEYDPEEIYNANNPEIIGYMDFLLLAEDWQKEQKEGIFRQIKEVKIV